jgi:hypothetical protein
MVTWCGIHSGTSQLVVLILTTLATPIPPLSGANGYASSDADTDRVAPGQEPR